MYRWRSRSSLFNVGLHMRVATCDQGSRPAIFLAVDIAMGSGADTEIVSASVIVVQCGIAYEGGDGEVRSG